MYESWPAPLPHGGTSEEMALVFPGKADLRLLIISPLFDEANKLRRQLREVMRLLSLQGFASVLPDLPGCNESLAPLHGQTLSSWRQAAEAAARHFAASHVLALRAGCALAPTDLPGWLYAPLEPARSLRQLRRAQQVSEVEIGQDSEHAEATLAGWTLGPDMLAELENAAPVPSPRHRVVEQEEIGGTPLWLRAEIGQDAAQADALAKLLAEGMASQ